MAPARDYLLYLPSGFSGEAGRPLLVWLHGCRQRPEEFAAGSGVLPALILHGSADAAVAQVNAARLARQFLLFNGAPPQELPANSLPPPARRAVIERAGALAARLRDWHVGGRLAVRTIEIEGLGHAWAGGAAGMDFFDPRGPEATRLVWKFFNELRRNWRS